MSTCRDCVKCEGVKLSSNCLIWEGITTEFETFNELIEFVYAHAKIKSNLDLKTLSNDSDNSHETAIQILIDKEVQRLYAVNSNSTSTSFSCTLNTSQIDNCSNCEKTLCEKLQLMVDEIATLKAEVNQLKSQL